MSYHSLNKDEKKVVKQLEQRYKKVIVGVFHNCRHNHKVGSYSKDGSKIKIYCGSGIREVFVIEYRQIL